MIWFIEWSIKWRNDVNLVLVLVTKKVIVSLEYNFGEYFVVWIKFCNLFLGAMNETYVVKNSQM